MKSDVRMWLGGGLEPPLSAEVCMVWTGPWHQGKQYVSLLIYLNKPAPYRGKGGEGAVGFKNLSLVKHQNWNFLFGYKDSLASLGDLNIVCTST